MRVLLVAHCYPPDGVAGVERYTEGLAEQLQRAGDQVTVLARRLDPSVWPIRVQRDRDRNGVEVIWLVGGTSALDHFLLHDEPLSRLFGSVLLEVEPEVVHFNHLVRLSPRSLAVAHTMGVPVVLTLHDFFMACPLVHLQRLDGELCAGPEGGLACARTCFAYEGPPATARWGTRTAFFRKVLATADRVICPSQYVGSFFQAFSPAPERIGVIPNGISLSRPAAYADTARALPPSLSGLRLAFFGSVVPLKGVHLIIQAVRMAGLRRLHLSIVGESPLPDYIQRLRDEAAAVPGLSIWFHGRYRPSDLPGLLRDTDCVVVPSQVPESFSITTREAMTLGIPVLASNIGALPEVIVDGHNGFVFGHNRPAQLAAILQLLYEEPALLARIRDGARATEVMTVGEHTAAVREVYRQAIAAFDRGRTMTQADADEQAMLRTLLAQLDFADPPPPVTAT
jgi:glycosyltransferase involved in cell wall biosynthesis